MALFNRTDRLEEESNLVEALFLGDLGKTGIHIGPLVVLTLGSIEQVGVGIGHAVVQQLEPDLGVLLFVIGSFLKKIADLDVAFLLGLGGIILILGVGLALTGECGHQIGLGLGPLQTFAHVKNSFQFCALSSQNKYNNNS